MDFPIALGELKFSLGRDDRKEEDEVVRSQKGQKPHRVPNKSSKLRQSKHVTREVLQKSVASRSSALRQGKFAAMRSEGEVEAFPAARAAATRALSTPVVTRNMTMLSTVSIEKKVVKIVEKKVL